jgi:BirA family biotin operon repressor/biotin-[acetyl-CoA-carboxylase] ligase
VSGAVRRIGCRIVALEEVDSTQSELARMATDAAEGTVVTARHQRQGRGRQGRRWWDRPGESLLVSVLLRPPIAVAAAPQLSHVGALAVVDAVHQTTGLGAGIRWPNDIVTAGRKLAGILPDAVSSAAGRLRHVLLGIGLNVNQTGFPAELGARATSLRLAAGAVQNAVAVQEALLDALDRRYQEFLDGGFGRLVSDWRNHALTLGERVRTPHGLEGFAEDVSSEGALMVRLDDGRLVMLWSGEIPGVAPD